MDSATQEKTFPSFSDLEAKIVAENEARKTDVGGYAHGDQSKWRIGSANKGNASQNTGLKQSASDRASISKGVKNKNDRIKLEDTLYRAF